MVLELQSPPPKPCHVAVVASPGMGHIIPLFEFAKRLAGEHGLRVSFLNITTGASAAQDHLLRSPTLPPNLHVIHLPESDASSALAAVPETQILARLSVVVDVSFKASLKTLLLNSLADVTALVIDLFCTAAFDICDEISVPVYSFVTTSAALFTFSLYLPTLDKDVADSEFVDLPEPVRAPGCVPIRTENLLDQVKNRKLDEYKWFLRHVSMLPRAAGIFVNTWEDLEPVTLRAVRENRLFYPEAVYPIGPVVKQDEEVSESGKTCLAWLDRQPENSVVFVALGSGGTLTSKQTEEMAWGLELSGQRFVWVVRPPSDVAFGTFFDSGDKKDAPDPSTYLPEGFGARTEARGLLVPSWAPQGAVLRHGATAAFVSHCGWNSTLESLAAGVAVVAWPMYAEQRMNAAILSEQVGVAVWPQVDPTTGLVTRAEIERAVREAVEGGGVGKSMRRRARELRDSAAAALVPGGSSYEGLTRVVKEWTSTY